MVLVLLGLGLIVCHFAGFGPMAEWNWQFMGDLWKFSLSFVAAAFWWAWADASGLTKRREVNREVERKSMRRERNIAAMGLAHLQKPRNGQRT